MTAAAPDTFIVDDLPATVDLPEGLELASCGHRLLHPSAWLRHLVCERGCSIQVTPA